MHTKSQIEPLALVSNIADMYSSVRCIDSVVTFMAQVLYRLSSTMISMSALTADLSTAMCTEVRSAA